MTAPMYQSHKKVRAIPFTRKEFITLRGWGISDGEDGDAEGYLVEYLDGGTPNIAGYANYMSWSPKEQFDNGYSRLNVELDTTELPKQIKVAPEHIESLMEKLTYQFERMGTSTTTICSASSNEFSVGIGKSGCVVATEFNAEKGKKYAKENALEEAKNKLWELEGYLLKITGHTSEYFVK